MSVSHSNVGGLLRKHGYQEIKKVGEGSFGKALLVRSEDGQKLICKMVDVSKASRREMEDAVKEGKLLSDLKHPYIVRYRESFSESGWLCILMDYCEGGDLTARIGEAKRGRRPIPEDQILRWLAQAVLALKYIHEKHVLHRDLKPSNFFLSKSGNLKMGDFGIAKVLACTIAVAKTQIGTPYYLSPELCQEKPYTFSSDVWAMGCILYELCALKVPFDAPNIPGLVQKIIKAPVPPVPATYSAFLRELVGQMLTRNPERRPSPEEILQKPQLQVIVKQMLDEAQEAVQAVDDGRKNHSDAGSAAAPSIPSAPSFPHAPSSSSVGEAGGYRMNDLIEYYSVSHGDWLPATVVKADSEGRIIIDLKPNTWISKEDQSKKVRKRKEIGAAAPGSRAGSRAGSPMRNPSIPSVGDRPAFRGIPSAPALGQSPSWGAGPGSRPGSRGASPLQRRSPALAAGAMAGLGSQPGSRAASPSRAQSPRQSRQFEVYRKHDLVDYWSVSHGEWLPATVVNTDLEGRIVIDLKPNTWLTKEDQTAKVRRRRVGTPVGALRRAPSADHIQAPSPRRLPSPGREAPFRAPSPRRREPTPRRSVPGIPPAPDSPLRAGY